jgi:hypothetical protein
MLAINARKHDKNACIYKCGCSVATVRDTTPFRSRHHINHVPMLQLADLKITLKGAAKVDHEVKERRDGSLLVKYISHMSGDVIITLVCPCPW